MEPARPILLLTRPEAQARRFLRAFRTRFGSDWPAVISPLTDIVFLSPPLPGPLPDHVLFTSENGVAGFARLCSDRAATAWCVGARTAASAEAAGFRTRAGPSDAAGLAAALIADGGVRRVLYARPVHTATDLAESLKESGIETVEAIVYDQRQMPATGDAARLVEGDRPVLLPLFSPRSARLAGQAFAGAVAPLMIAAISPATSEAGLALPAKRRVTATHPDAAAMLDALGAIIEAEKTG